MDYALNPADGIRIAYRVTGAGSPIVLVHGTALSQAIWRGFGYVRALQDEHTVVTLDLRGHGRSDKPHEPGAYRMDLFVGDVLAVLDALGLPAVGYLGYSLGARVGFSLAATAPARMLRLASEGGAPSARPGSFDRVFFPGCIDALADGGMEGFLDGWQRHSGSPVDPNTRIAFLANDAAALAAYMREAEHDTGVDDAVLADLDLPTLMLAGTRDPERMRAAEHVAQVMPHASVLVLDGATHGDTPRHPDALPAARAFFGPL